MDINVPVAEELQSRINEPGRLLFAESNTRIRADIRRVVEATVARFGKL